MPDPETTPEAPATEPEARAEIKAGDVVAVDLPTGHGPAMSVTDVSPNGDVKCCWFDTTGAFHERTFHATQLCHHEEHEHEEPAAGVPKRGRVKSRHKARKKSA